MKKSDLVEKSVEEDNVQLESEAAQQLSKEKDEEIVRLKESLAEAEKKIKYLPKPAVVPEEQMGLPSGMQESQIKTTVTDISTIIAEKMLQLKDLATAEVMIDTFVRMKNRLESIKKLSSADHIKVRGIWKTIRPQMYISNLEGKKLTNDEMEITFGVYDVDEKGNKKLYVHYADVHLHDGSMIKRPTSAEYRIAYEVVERIKRGKPITREVIKIDRIQNR